MRLNRRGLGTGLLWRRIVPAVFVLAMAGSSLLWMSDPPRRGNSESAAQIPIFRPGADSIISRPAVASYGHLPLMFEPNMGQTDSRVRFVARGNGYGLFLTEQEAVLSLRSNGENGQAKGSVVRMKLLGANAHPTVAGTELLPGKSSYFIGKDASKWRQNIPQYGRVEYTEIYPGVDLTYYGSQGHLEYDFRVAPGSDPRAIQLTFDGAQSVKLDAGDLVIATGAGDVRLAAPRVYQSKGENRQTVDGHFALLADGRVGFEIGDYDQTKTLVIDPVLAYSTYLGGTGTERLPTITVDSASSFYVTGTTNSADFPVTDASTLKSGATSNVFVAKFDPTGATLEFAGYVGGTGADSPVGIAVDAATNIYVAGTTNSTDFPTSSSAFQATPKSPGNQHAFVFVMNFSTASNGYSFGYSTYLSGGNSDTASNMALDNKGNVYVIGITNSTDFPLAPTAGTFQSGFQGANAFFISKITPTSTGANSLVFSTYFGGGFPTTATVSGGAIAVDNNATVSNIFITGGTNYLFTGQNSTTDFPIRNAFQPCLGTAPTTPLQTTCPTNVTLPDAFVAKINPGTTTGAQLLYCTYLGGANTDVGLGIGVDASGNAYVTGKTDSPQFPQTSGSITGYQTALKGGFDAFVAKINNPATGSTSSNVQLTYFSYLGGSADDVGNAIVVDTKQGARVVGTTASSDFPIIASSAIQTSLLGSSDAFVARINTLGTSSTSDTSQFVTYFGGSGADTGTGIAIDTDSNTYVSGETTSSDLKTVNPFQSGLKGPQDAFAAKLGPNLNFTLSVAAPGSNSVNAGNQITYNYTLKNVGDTTANVAFTDNLSSGSGSAPVTFVSASAAGGTCPTAPTDNKVLCNLGTMNGGDSTTVTVNLTPTGAGTVANSGTVSVGGYSTTKAAPPVNVNSYKLTPLQTTNTVVAGNPATYPIMITPLSSYTASISITCTAGLPGGGTTCSPSTNPITLQGSSPSTVTLVISTVARVTTTAGIQPGRGLFYASWLPVTGLAFVGLGIGTRLRRGRRMLGGLLFLALATLILLQPACSGHSSTSTTTGTPAGTYTINVVATSGSFSQTSPITLVVQ